MDYEYKLVAIVKYLSMRDMKNSLVHAAVASKLRDKHDQMTLWFPSTQVIMTHYVPNDFTMNDAS